MLKERGIVAPLLKVKTHSRSSNSNNGAFDLHLRQLCCCWWPKQPTCWSAVLFRVCIFAPPHTSSAAWVITQLWNIIKSPLNFIRFYVYSAQSLPPPPPPLLKNVVYTKRWCTSRGRVVLKSPSDYICTHIELYARTRDTWIFQCYCCALRNVEYHGTRPTRTVRALKFPDSIHLILSDSIRTCVLSERSNYLLLWRVLFLDKILSAAAPSSQHILFTLFFFLDNDKSVLELTIGYLDL